ncbi:MAG: extracellular solute-binding protein [Planctomycetales bacterium]|nr:extracellular solute-binding protein [Planctomycetales bacterium]
MIRNGLRLVVLASLLATAIGCLPYSEQEVIVYAALDREFSEPILNDFQTATGIQTLAKYDVESTKTVGLVSAIIQEQNRPRCDVFWNNEILHTLRLERLGLLDVYHSPAAETFPLSYRSASAQWHGLAARARVLIINTDLVDRDSIPTSVNDLTDTKWKGQVGIAKPLFGTTATHAAVLFSIWGDERATAFFRAIRENAEVMSGNKQVAAAVGRGQLAFGITDTDDAIIEIDNGMPVEIVFPDQAEGELGSLFIPNSLCILKDCQNPVNARRLVDYLLSPEIEERLATGSSAQFPVNEQVTTRSRASPNQPVRWMKVDFEAAADSWAVASSVLRDLFVAVD